MPVPEFIRSLRARVGSELLWLPGVTGVVFDGTGRVLVGQRSDTGEWALPSGIPEPGEQMARALAREVAEETGVEVVVERLLGIWTLPPMTYPNGDRCQFVDHAFLCRATGGVAHVADDESLAVAWSAVADLPELRRDQRDLVALAQRPDEGPVFVR